MWFQFQTTYVSKSPAQCLAQLGWIESRSFVLAAEQTACLSTGINNSLTPRPPNRIKCPESGIDLSFRRDVAYQMAENECVLNDHPSAGALPGRGRVGGIADNTDSVVGVGGRGFVLPLGIPQWGFLIQDELDTSKWCCKSSYRVRDSPQSCPWPQSPDTNF